MPEALAGVRAVLRRAHRAAAFALGFAAHRLDPDAAVIHEATLLHNFAEVLLWRTRRCAARRHSRPCSASSWSTCSRR
jgi:hypothetical protein